MAPRTPTSWRRHPVVAEAVEKRKRLEATLYERQETARQRQLTREYGIESNAMETRLQQAQAEYRDALVAEATNLIHDLKLVKSPAEFAYIRRAVEIADAGMEAFAKALGEGRTELALAGKVYDAMLSAGSGLAASPINIVSGERSGFSHGAPTERKLRRVFWSDPALGVARYVDAGYPEAREEAARHGLDLAG